MSCLSYHSFIHHNKHTFYFLHSIDHKECALSNNNRIHYFLNCHHSTIDDSNTHQSILIEDCSNSSFQLGIVENTVVVRNCKQITLSVCCNRLIIMFVRCVLVTFSNCDGILTYTFTCSNPIYIKTNTNQAVIAPYNIPRKNLIDQLEKLRMNCRNCWDLGVDLNGVHFSCAVLPPALFSPVLSHTEETDHLQLPLLPQEYEDVFIQALQKVSHVFKKQSILQEHLLIWTLMR